MATYDTLRNANITRDREWDPEHHITRLFRAVELAGEAGEAFNVVKKLEREQLGLRGSRTTTAALAEELADIIICVDLLAMSYGIGLTHAIEAKFNKTSETHNLATRLKFAEYD